MSQAAKQLGLRLSRLGLVTSDQFTDAIGGLSNPIESEMLGELEKRGLLTPFQLQKLRKGETNGYFVGKYKILYKVASGAFARVFRGVDTIDGRVVAIKILRDRHAADSEQIRQFHREAKVTQRLLHPNITQTLEVGIDPDTNQHYIVMEFIEGGNFKEFLRIRGCIAAEETTRLAIEMFEGLKYAFANGVSHRDIRLKNILVSALGQVKWVDFGLAGLQEGAGDGFVTEQRTVDYAALEKATGAPIGDVRSDIFFAGTLIYQMLTGSSPLPEMKLVKGMRPRFDQIPSLRMKDNIPTGLADVVDRLLAYRPEQRYQNYDAILKDLQALAPPKATGDQVATAESETPAILRVMLIHRNQNSRELFKEQLAPSGYQVIATGDAQRAAALHQLNPADCWIIDMPSAGPEGVKEYLKLSPVGQIKAVFMTDQHDKQYLKDVHPKRTIKLMKPVKLNYLLTALDYLLRRPSSKDKK